MLMRNLIFGEGIFYFLRDVKSEKKLTCRSTNFLSSKVSFRAETNVNLVIIYERKERNTHYTLKECYIEK